MPEEERDLSGLDLGELKLALLMAALLHDKEVCENIQQEMRKRGHVFGSKL
jgi:hypothetical protein